MKKASAAAFVLLAAASFGGLAYGAGNPTATPQCANGG